MSAVERSYNRSLSSVRIAVEHLLERMSYFGAVSPGFRHRRERHSGVVRVVAWLVGGQIAGARAAGVPA